MLIPVNQNMEYVLEEDFFLRHENFFFDTFEKLKDIDFKRKNCVYTYFSTGKFSTHDILFAALKQIGPSDLHFMTWGLGKRVVELLSEAKESGQILNITAKIDRRMVVTKDSIFSHASGVFDNIMISDCHGKVFVLQNNNYHVTCITSGNFNRNKKIEVGTIITDLNTANFLKLKICS